MSRDRYAEGCPGCRPVMIDMTTGQVLPPWHPAMRAANRAFDKATPAHRQAFHRVTCLSSRATKDIELGQELMQMMAKEPELDA